MRLHLLGLPHTVTSPLFSSCAFTSKVLRFSPMMRSVGYKVTHYGVQGADAGANEQVSVLKEAEWVKLGGKYPGTEQHGSLANTDSPLYHAFNGKLIPLLRERLQPHDVICLPFGHAHGEAMQHFPEHQKLETGIGYPVVFPRAPNYFRVYESNAWMHFHLGKEAQAAGGASGTGSDYDHVIPNYFDPDEWTLGTGLGGYLLYFGRLNQDKGLDVVWEIARARGDLRVILCGQGDASPWLTLPNIEYLPPIHGAGRDKLLGDALATLCPTRYVEPFGGVTVESHLCGTPVLGSSFGSFTETIEQGCNGFRCRTLADWLNGIAVIERGEVDSRQQIRADAVRRYSMWNVAWHYQEVFRKLADLWGQGWYALPPRLRELAHAG